MPLKIFLSSTLRRHVPGYDPVEGLEMAILEPRTVAEVCQQMNIPTERIKMVMVNGKHRNIDHVLHGEERVGLFPPVGGG
jgi:molybdopterin synthase sulfur carrier subunit